MLLRGPKHREGAAPPQDFDPESRPTQQVHFGVERHIHVFVRPRAQQAARGGRRVGAPQVREPVVELLPANAAVDRGLVPVYWDNGGRGSGGESFALFDRSANSVLHPELLQAMLRAATSAYTLADIARPKPAQ